MDSEEIVREDGHAGNVFDDHAFTIWHTNYDTQENRNLPHEIIFRLDSLYMVNGFRYLPRQNNNRNGRIRRYELYVSDILNEIKNNDKLIAKGTWDDNEMHKDIFFDEPIKAKFFRLVALEDWSGGNFTTAAEIRVFGNVTDELGDTSVTLSVDRNELKKIKIYPNPTKGYMNINNTESGNPFDASVFNLMGKLIKKFSVKNSYKLDVSNFNSGMYFIVFKDSHGNLVETSKIIKQ